MKAPTANASPWLAELAERPTAPAISADARADVAIVGAGIAGLTTAFFTLADTDRSVLLLEADRVAHGATGFNAGQLATYFERPLCRIAAEHGFERTLAAQRDVLDAWHLLDRVIAEAKLATPVLRFPGHMGMFTLDHVAIHLENNALRARAGLPREEFLVSEEASYRSAIPEQYADLYAIVPQRAIGERLETDTRKYTAVLSERKGCVNPARLCDELAAHLSAAYPQRFRLAERTRVDGIVLEDGGGATLACGPHRVRADHAVLCTNGFREPVDRPLARVHGTVGFMAGFFEPLRAPSAVSYVASPRIGEGQAYFYVTRRPFRRDGRELTFTSIGGPDAGLAEPGAAYDRGAAYPHEILERLDAFIRPLLAPGRTEPLAYEYAWHGLMGYTADQLRVIGADPRHPALLYNLGCNGVGLLPSIHGGGRIARLLGGERLAPSLFDPR